MITLKSLAAGAIACGLVASAFAQDIKFPSSSDASKPADKPAPAAPETAAAAAPAATFTDQQLLEEFGWFVGKRVGISQLKFTDADVAALSKGFAAAALDKESPFDTQKIGPALDQFIQKKQQIYTETLKAQGTQASSEFFAKLKDNKNVVFLPSGLAYEVLTDGDKATFPKAADTVSVNYTGTLINGTIFDSNAQSGKPVEFPLGNVIPGWTEGLQHISKGGKIKLYVPANLAYGDEGQPGIPPGSTLIFEVELLDVKAAAAAPAAK